MALARRAFCSSPHCSTSQKTMQFEVTHFSNFVHIPYYDVPKGHVCTYSPDNTSDTALLLPRPRARRNPLDWGSDATMCRKFRSQSMDRIPRKLKTKKNHCYSSRSTNTDTDPFMSCPPRKYDHNRQLTHYRQKKKPIMNGISTVSCSTNTINEEDGIMTESARRLFEKKSGMGDSKSSSSIGEHEYLQFLLRVTEDIIINNYILNEDIDRVFNQHIEMNKHVLDEKKMREHLINLALDLNLSGDQATSPKDTSLQISTSEINIQYLNTSCQCETPVSPVESLFGAVIEQEKESIENIEEEVYYKHSLGRVTECTEPSNSSATIVGKTTNTNVLSFNEIDNLNHDAKSEIVGSNEEIDKDLHFQEPLSDIALSDKSSLEDSLNDIPDESAKTYSIEKVRVIGIPDELRYKNYPIKVDCGTETAIANFQMDVTVQVNLPPNKVTEQSCQTTTSIMLDKPDLITKGTQSTSLVCNKKCDTEDLNEYIAETTPEKKQDQSTIIPEDEVLSLTNRSEVEVEGGMNTYLDLKLMGDDYDLTPERDTSEKYHFLMTDASTSMVKSQVAVATNVGIDSLLLGDAYDLHEDSALQSIRDIEDSTAYLRTKIPFYEDDISASISQSCSMTESPGWISDKPGLQYPVLKKFSKAKVLVRLNTCTNTSTTSVKT
ncbi:uncharacterized protein LOC114338964 isoform X2 [Diabrotica virgifera virgifera]|uniref:Spermatogenesis-associated protein 7 n=1 Tax=Diabrotica virgifera virgifera TaxID=50390 RepID=A0ABM5K3H8_DIAVI|nr:uncharacterized protein LOC114338964 isoform X2 [Diabrotica virgifera virgifera]